MDSFVLTFDIDWVPDFMIDRIASVLKEKRVRATWFVTHDSPAIGRLREEPDLFELGIHPNFLPGSTHGRDHVQVLDHMLSIVPDAISMRSHAVVQSGPLLQFLINQTPLRLDSTLFLPGCADIRPFEHISQDKALLRVPFFWTDDYEIEKTVQNWHIDPYIKVKGLKVFDFHPVHIYLNSASFEPYHALKKGVKYLGELTEQMAAAHVHAGEGPQTVFLELVDYLATLDRTLCLRDMLTAWKNGK